MGHLFGISGYLPTILNTDIHIEMTKFSTSILIKSGLNEKMFSSADVYLPEVNKMMSIFHSSKQYTSYIPVYLLTA